MKQKLKQIIYDIHHQPVIAWVTFIATALSIFLIMVVIMMQQVKIIPFAPESCRPRLLVGAYMHIRGEGEDGPDMSAGLNYPTARTLYEGLDGAERISYFTKDTDPTEVKGPGSETFSVMSRWVDAEFFNIFDHNLIAGRYFTKEEADALIPNVVISENTARHALGDEANWIGSQLIIGQKYYNVIGVVSNTSSLASLAYGDAFMPTGPADPENAYSDNFSRLGRLSVAILVKDGVDFQHIRDQVKARYAIIDAELAPDNVTTVYHESPFDIETIAAGLAGSNNTPDPESGRNMRLAIYAIMLIVPAINLSSMLHSRLRRRISEIGVRRAFGCTRSRIITDIVVENFLVTLIGGIVGIALGVIFASTYSGLYEDMENFGRGDTPGISAVLNLSTIVISLGVCFILNLLSASIPAWQASRVSPVEAINSK